jgi:topoisomerase-4 subunit A
LAELIGEWCVFRIRTVHRRTEYRLQKADDRIHILEGRHIVFLNIDEVIRIIRESDDPKAALIARFSLSDRQAKTFSKSACVNWPGSKGSESSRNWRNCAASVKD